MNPLLRDFFGHQSWADAEHWRAIEAHPSAAADAAIQTRLHHIHMVQRVFLWAVGDRAAGFAVTKPGDFASLADLKAHARGAARATSSSCRQAGRTGSARSTAT